MLDKIIPYILGIFIGVFIVLGIYSLFVGFLFYLSDVLIGTAIFKWNYVLFFSILIMVYRLYIKGGVHK